MTYPQQQGYAPQVQHIDPRYAQQYGQPQQPQGPQSYPGAVVTYPQPPQQQYAPAPQAAPTGPPQGQGVMPSTPKLGDGGGGGGGTVSPKLRHLDGRTIVVLPRRVDEDAIDPQTKQKRPEAHFDLIVVDGGPLRYGDNVDDRNPEKNRPNTHEIDTPCVFTSATDIGAAFVSCVRDALAAGEPGRAGVIERGTKGFRPFLITRCGEHVDRSTRVGGDAKYAEAMRIFDLVWQAKHGGAPFVSPEPRSLVAPPAAPQPQVAYQSTAPAGYAQQQYAQTGTVPTPYGAAPAQQLHPEYVAAATQPQYVGYAQPQSAPPAGWPQGSGPGGYHMPGDAPPAQYVPAPNEPVLPPPVEAWLASLPEGQRAVSRAAYVAQQMGQGPQGAPQAPQGGPGM